MPKGVYARRQRPPKTYPGELVTKVRRLYASGLTQNEIATAIGTTQKVVWRLMRHHGIESRAAVQRDPARGAASRTWKGDAASYKAFHLRLRATKGAPARCEICRTEDPRRRRDWANLTGKYEDQDDYARMCRRRHDNARRGGAIGLRRDVTTVTVQALRARGLSLNAIAARLGVSWPTVRSRLPQ